MKNFGLSGDEVGRAKVWNGNFRYVGLILEYDLNVMLPVLSSSDPSFSIEYFGPIKAPVERGDKVAELVIKSQDLPDTRHTLLAESSVSAGGFFVQIRTAGENLFNVFFSKPGKSF